MPAHALAPPWVRRASARPGLRSRLAALGNGAEGPHQLAALDVEGAHVAGRRGQALGDPAAEDQQVAVDDAGSVGDHEELRRLRVEALMQVDRSARHRSCRWACRSWRRSPTTDRPQRRRSARRSPVAPVGEPAIDAEAEQAVALGERVEAPELLAGGGVEGERRERCARWRRERRPPRSGCTGSESGSRRRRRRSDRSTPARDARRSRE